MSGLGPGGIMVLLEFSYSYFMGQKKLCMTISPKFSFDNCHSAIASCTSFLSSIVNLKCKITWWNVFSP